MSTPTIGESIDQAILDFAVINAFVRGPSNTSVEAGQGTLPTLAGIVATIPDRLVGALITTSTTNTTVSKAIKAFQIEVDKFFKPGQWVTITSGSLAMAGRVVSLTNTTLLVNVLQTIGMGSSNNWIISLSGLSDGRDASEVKLVTQFSWDDTHWEPSNYTLPNVDPALTLALHVAVDSAAKPNKRVAGANALVAAMSPDVQLVISQDGTAIITVDYSGPMVVVSDSTDVYVTTPTQIDEAVISRNGDLAVGTWTYAITGGAGLLHYIKGSVGITGSGADLELPANPESGADFVDGFKLMFDPNLDA